MQETESVCFLKNKSKAGGKGSSKGAQENQGIGDSAFRRGDVNRRGRERRQCTGKGALRQEESAKKGKTSWGRKRNKN